MKKYRLGYVAGKNFGLENFLTNLSTLLQNVQIKKMYQFI